MVAKRLEYIIVAPAYDENNGGSLFLHRLAERLQELGHSVQLSLQGPIYPLSRRKRLSAFIFPAKRTIGPRSNLKWLRQGQSIGDAIVVYPEVVPGNPLGAKHVVRWLLNKPGLVHPFVETQGEMYFKAGNFSDDPTLTGHAPLLTAWRINPVYSNRLSTDRSGTCYMVRKGRDRDIVHELEGSICLDGKSHTEIAEIFNRSEVFYCYDEMTMYSQYAALCGCLSVVIPKYFTSHEDYIATRRIARFGVSYGFDHFDHARATQHLVAGLLEEMAAESDMTIDHFVELTQRRFATVNSG